MSTGSHLQRVATDVAALEALSIDELRATWRERFGEPPPLRSGDLMRRRLAERIQEDTFGFDPQLARELAKLAARRQAGRSLIAAEPEVRVGTRLAREHEGVTHRVDVVEGGYVWQGRTYRSLSRIAREITGVRWNGPRFFGLREVAA